jgi:hypothetical protein
VHDERVFGLRVTVDIVGGNKRTERVCQKFDEALVDAVGELVTFARHMAVVYGDFVRAMEVDE